jgi:hypothetical protein
MWQSIPVILACLGADDCRPFVGQQMANSQCVATSQVLMAEFLRQHPGYKLKGLSCVEPRRLQTVLGRSQA